MKQMPRNRILAAALCLAAVAAVLVYAYMSRLSDETRQPVAVVAASEDIPARTIITKEMVKLSDFPRKLVPPNAAVSVDSVVGKVALQMIREGNPISMNQLAARGAALGLSYAVPPLMRAVTVALDPIIGVAGFLKPGDHVDVVATFDVNDGTVTKTVLQDVELLAIGSQVVEGEIDPGTGKPAKPQTYPNATLAVTPQDAEKLILAESKGKLRLTLRYYGDQAKVISKGITSRQLIGYVPPDVPEKTSSASSVRQTVASRPSPPPIVRETPPIYGIPPLTTQAVAQEEAGKKVQVVRGTKIEEVAVSD
ncbi:MAG: Flp pilus assembly protein CpaB [Armatimonadota bacterium]|nr:Flp pilus assembly protein CpaB [Armatimonadota bacterium]